MKTIFEKANVGGITLKNRIIRSATQEGAADQDGHITEKLISIYEKLAAGGAGAAITGMVGVDENSRVFPHMVKAYDDDFVCGLSKVVNKVHTLDCKIIVQLAHCGVKANPDNGNKLLAPSDFVLSEDKSSKSMTKEEIQSVIHSFALAADRVLTKSISRFARNTMIVLEAVRELKSLGVEVIFEKENISSFDGDGELLLTVLSSFAQEESKNISDNIKWRYKRQFDQGEVAINTTRFLGYDKDQYGDLVINRNQAKIVERIFNDCVNGKGTSVIAKELVL